MSVDINYQTKTIYTGDKCCKRLCSSILVPATLLVTCVVLCTLPLVVISQLKNIPSEPQLGHHGDTIRLAILRNFLQSKVQVSVCDQAGDSPHIDFVYLIKEDNITIHQMNETFESTQFDQDLPSTTTGLVNYLYLVTGSRIQYRICLGSLKKKRLTGSLFIFNDQNSFLRYQDDPQVGEQESIFSEELAIGNDNESVCMSMVYEAPETSYYFIASRTPGGIFYAFNYTKQVNYYNHSDYEPALCSIYEDQPCEVTVPGSPYSFDGYVLLAYVRPNVATTGIQNHICVTVTQSNGDVLVSSVSGSIGGLALIILVGIVLVVLFTVIRRRQYRKGYAPIQSSPPPAYDNIQYA